MKYPLVSIIFVTYNGIKDTLLCIESLKKQVYPQDKMELIMVDNNSSDGSPEMVNEKFPEIEITRLSQNKGYAYAVNEGIKKSQGEYIFVINNDVVFDKNCLKELVEKISSSKNIGVIGGKIYYKYPSGKIDFCGEKFNPYTTILRQLPYPDQPKETDWVEGAAMLFRKELIEKTGLWDPGFFFYFEDADFCFRAKKAGYKILYWPKAVMWHGVGKAINKEEEEKKQHYWFKSKFRFIFKNSKWYQIVVAILLTLAFVAYKKIFLGKKIYELMALKDNLKNLKELLAQRRKFHERITSRNLNN